MFAKISLSLFLLSSFQNVLCEDKPNIIYFLIDDWGYNDVGYYGNTDTETPFIDKLVKEESVRLDKYYVLPECTATRCALLTGRYPMRYGMQAGILYYRSAYALTRQEQLLSNEFQDQGYETHLVGKWHLGMISYDYVPNQRGFDTFLGYYAGLIYYYDHTGIEDMYPDKVDFHWNNDGFNDEDRFTLYTYTDRILNIIDENVEKQNNPETSDDEKKPFFMYVGWQGSHTPSEAPEEYMAKYSDNSHEDERNYFQAQTTLTDDLLETIVNYLKIDANIWDNTILIVASDNGAERGYGDNAPLRGSKFTLWEGGVRVPAFITGGYLPDNLKGSIVSDVSIHVTDWYPTLLTAANINKQSTNELDGMDIWKYLISGGNEEPIFQNVDSRKDEFEIDIGKEIQTIRALDKQKEQNIEIQKTQKIEKMENIENENINRNEIITNKNIEKTSQQVHHEQQEQQRHLLEKEEDSRTLYSNNDVNKVANDRYIVLNVNSYDCDTEFGLCGGMIYNGRWKLLVGWNGLKSSENGEPDIDTCFWHRDFALSSEIDGLGCGAYPFSSETGTCDCNDYPCLFDLENDPCEYNNVYNDYSAIADRMVSKLNNYYNNEQVHSLYASMDAVSPDVAALGDQNSYWKPWYEDAYEYTNWENIEFEKKLLQWQTVGYSSDEDDGHDAIHAKIGKWHIGKNGETSLSDVAKIKFLLIVVGATFVFAVVVACWHLFWINKKKFIDDMDINSNNNNNNDIESNEETGLDYDRILAGKTRYGSVAF